MSEAIYILLTTKHICFTETLLNELSRDGPYNLTIASLTAGIDSYGLGKLYESGKVKRMIGSYVGENKVEAHNTRCIHKIYLLDLELTIWFNILIEFRTYVLHG